MIDVQMKTMRDMGNAASVVREFAACDVSKAIVVMLDALIDSYKIDLMRVTPEELVQLQTSILQTQAIRNVVANESKDLPKI